MRVADRKQLSPPVRRALAAEIRALLDERDPRTSKKRYSQARLGSALGELSQEAVRRAQQPDGATPALLEGVLKLKGMTVEQLLTKHSEAIDVEPTGAVLHAEAGSFAVTGGNVAFRVHRRSLKRVRERLLERYPRDIVNEAIASSSFVDDQEGGDDLDAYLALEREIIELVEPTPRSSRTARSPDSGGDPGGDPGGTSDPGGDGGTRADVDGRGGDAGPREDIPPDIADRRVNRRHESIKRSETKGSRNR